MLRHPTAIAAKVTVGHTGSGLPRLQALTSLRFVAAAMIVFEHARPYTGQDVGWAATVPWSHGVSFFFVLSGFILTYNYRALETPAAVMRFWIARVARVWPVHALTAIIALATVAQPAAATVIGSVAVVVANLLLVQAWVPIMSVGYSLNGASWSVSTELFFYMLFPLLLFDWQRTWHRKLGLALLLLVAVVACGNAARGVQWTVSDQEAITHAVAYIHPFARLFEFTLGMAGYLLWRRLDRWDSWTPIVASFAELGTIVLAVHWLTGQPVLALVEPVGGPTGAEWARYAGSCLVFALMVPVIAAERGVISWGLTFPLLVLLGEISYSMYLFHTMVLELVAYEFPGMLVGIELAGWTLLWLAVIGVAWLSWALVEVPARRWILHAWDARVAAHGSGLPLSTAPSAAVHRG
jgi:peptidoglycan/LPS O-acetylase OafA/YrhL